LQSPSKVHSALSSNAAIPITGGGTNRLAIQIEVETGSGRHNAACLVGLVRQHPFGRGQASVHLIADDASCGRDKQQQHASDGDGLAEESPYPVKSLQDQSHQKCQTVDPIRLAPLSSNVPGMLSVQK
jgi:hypothetical protein